MAEHVRLVPNQASVAWWFGNFEQPAEFAVDWLELDDLLDQFVQRLTVAAAADTAVVLLPDARSDDLVVAAARGLKEPVQPTTRVRLPVLSVTNTARPIRLDQVEPYRLLRPLLSGIDLVSQLVAPLVINRQAVGTVCIGRTGNRTFTEHDKDVFQLATRWLGALIRSRELARQHAINQLMRYSEPGESAYSPSLELASYLPAQEGDIDCHWLDVFSLPSGAAWIIAGEVAGHDLDSAIRLEEVRTTLRAIALETDSPAHVLEHADRALQLSKTSGPIPIACAAAAEPYDELRISSAGHAPPMFLTPGQPPTPIELEQAEPPLGVLPGPRRTSITIPFPPGSVILAYTGAVIERPRSFSGTNIADVCITVRDAPPDQLSNTMLDAIRKQNQGAFNIGLAAMRRRTRVP